MISTANRETLGFPIGRVDLFGDATSRKFERTPAPRNLRRSLRVIVKGEKRAIMLEFSMSPTIQQCVEHARQCEWYAARANEEEDRKSFL